MDFYVAGEYPIVENRGNGVALNLMVEIGDTVVLGPIGVLGPNEKQQIPNRRVVSAMDSYEAVMTFYDALGTGYRVVKRQLINGTSYVDLFRRDEETDTWHSTTSLPPPSPSTS